MSARRTVGTTISKAGTNIGLLTKIGTPEKSADTKEVTTLDITDGYKRYIPGLKDGGEVPVEGYFDVGDAGQMALDTAFEAGTEDTYVITFPAAIGASITFNAIITKYSPGEVNTEDPLSFSMTLKVTGKPVLATAASGGLTALTLAGTAGALSPTFNNAKYAYSWSFTTDTQITVTPTAASHTFDIYVDGVLLQTGLASGAASLAITGFSAAATSKNITIVAKESGKTAKVYSVVAIRTA